MAATKDSDTFGMPISDYETLVKFKIILNEISSFKLKIDTTELNKSFQEISKNIEAVKNSIEKPDWQTIINNVISGFGLLIGIS